MIASKETPQSGLEPGRSNHRSSFGRDVFAEVRYFFTAVQFLTRIPIQSFETFEGVWIDRAAKYFPFVGALVGACCASVLLASNMVWTGALPALIAVAAGVLITGAFHEDGFADFFDSLGGTSRDQRLSIMKDSRLGTFGTLALGFGIAAKVIALSSMPVWIAAVALIAAHAGGRFAALCVIPVLPYAGVRDLAKVTPLSSGVKPMPLLFAGLCALTPLLLLPVFAAIVALSLGVVVSAILAGCAKRLLGGYTGDVLGAVEQSFEIGFALGIASCV